MDCISAGRRVITQLIFIRDRFILRSRYTGKGGGPVSSKGRLSSGTWGLDLGLTTGTDSSRGPHILAGRLKLSSSTGGLNRPGGRSALGASTGWVAFFPEVPAVDIWLEDCCSGGIKGLSETTTLEF